MVTCRGLVSGEDKLALVGLGYVGMPIAVAFSQKVNVIGFDLNDKKSSYTKVELTLQKRWEMTLSPSVQ